MKFSMLDNSTYDEAGLFDVAGELGIFGEEAVTWVELARGVLWSGVIGVRVAPGWIN